MAVERIEEFSNSGVAKVWLVPSKQYPQGGYFYTDLQYLDVVNAYTWRLAFGRGETYIYNSSDYYGLFHDALAERILGYPVQYIDHINLVQIDNVDKNLNIVGAKYNQRNRVTRGYRPNCGSSKLFQPKVNCDYKSICGKCVKTEDEACVQQHLLERLHYADYNYDFFKDRRGNLDILDLERTGQISEEEATYRHILRYADNAWYYLRYNLEEYFRENHIPVPKYSLDERGYMIHPITGQKLCPIKYSGGRG